MARTGVSVLTVALFAGQALGATTGGGVPADVPALFWAAVGARGATYAGFRDRLVAGGEASRPFLEQMAQNGAEWQERAMARVLLERLDKPTQVAGLLEWTPQVEESRRPSIRVARYGEALAARCAETPMVLVERIWKHNGLLAKHPPLNAKAYAAEALGNLRVAGAVGALCHLVLSEEAPDGAYCPVRVWAAADALGKIGDRRAVPALLRLHLLYRSSGAAGDALDKCIDRSTIRTVRVFARRINDQHVRRLLEAIADRKAKELAAGEE